MQSFKLFLESANPIIKLSKAQADELSYIFEVSEVDYGELTGRQFRVNLEKVAGLIRRIETDYHPSHGLESVTAAKKRAMLKLAELLRTI